jgi:hypothetical protein
VIRSLLFIVVMVVSLIPHAIVLLLLSIFGEQGRIKSR